METSKYKGKIVEVVEFNVTQAGKQLVFEKARRSPGVRLIVKQGDSILITKEERHEQGGYDYRLPGGKVFDTLTEYTDALTSGADMVEAAKKAAIKEAREEAYVEVKDASFLYRSICGTTVEWDLFYFVAQEAESLERARVDAERTVEEAEDISVEFMDREQVKRMCLEGSIKEERSALVLLRYLSGNFENA